VDVGTWGNPAGNCAAESERGSVYCFEAGVDQYRYHGGARGYVSKYRPSQVIEKRNSKQVDCKAYFASHIWKSLLWSCDCCRV